MAYSVFFENNIATKAINAATNNNANQFIEFGKDKNRPTITSLYIEAETEQDAMEIANKVVRNIWGEVLGLDKALNKPDEIK